MDGLQAAVLACVGCGCAGGMCAAPENMLPPPVEQVRIAVVETAKDIWYGSDVIYEYR